MEYKALLHELKIRSKKSEEDFLADFASGRPLGVNIPSLRSLAKEMIAKGEKPDFIEIGKNLETDMIYAWVNLAYLSNVREKLDFAFRLFSLTGHWALTDSLDIRTGDFSLSKPYIDKAITSVYPFLRRFGYVFMLQNFVREPYVDYVLAGLKDDGHYYVRMAEAWLLAECYIKCRDKTIAYLQTSSLGYWIINKGISKIHDSFRVNEEYKQLAKTYRRKK